MVRRNGIGPQELYPWANLLHTPCGVLYSNLLDAIFIFRCFWNIGVQKRNKKITLSPYFGKNSFPVALLTKDFRFQILKHLWYFSIEDKTRWKGVAQDFYSNPVIWNYLKNHNRCLKKVSHINAGLGILEIDMAHLFLFFFYSPSLS